MLEFPQIDPVALQIELGTFSFALKWYALSYWAGVYLGWAIAIAALKRSPLWPQGRAPMAPSDVTTLAIFLVMGIVAGGRLGYVLFYEPWIISQAPLRLFVLSDGGMSFHGGFAGVSLAAALYAWRMRIPLLGICDLLALSAPPGLLLGRIANFINAELWGTPTALPWGVVFPGDAAQSCAGIEGPCARHPSQLYEAGLEGLILGGLLLVLAFRFRGLSRPGLISGLFFAGYGASRIFVEMFRQADLQFISETNPSGHVLRISEFGLSMGQALSLPMLAAGLALILTTPRRSPKSIAA